MLTRIRESERARARVNTVWSVIESYTIKNRGDNYVIICNGVNVAVTVNFDYIASTLQRDNVRYAATINAL